MIEEITAYLRSKKLPKDEITYPPELMGQIAIQAFEEQEEEIENLKDLELERELQEAEDSIEDLKVELQEAKDSIKDLKLGLQEAEGSIKDFKKR